MIIVKGWHARKPTNKHFIVFRNLIQKKNFYKVQSPK